MKTLAEQIKCAESEAAYRRGYFPELTTMPPKERDHEIECMEAIVETLKEVEAHQQRTHKVYDTIWPKP